MKGKTYKALRYAGLFLLVVLLFAQPALANEPVFSEDSETVSLRGRVVSVEDLQPEGEGSQFVELEQLATIEITRGEYQGQQFTILNELMGHPLYDLYLEEGRMVSLWGEVDPDGSLRQIYLQDYVRDTYLYIVLGIFVLAILVVGGKKGLLTLVTLAVTIFAISRILLPLLLRGYPPIPTTIGVALIITLVTLIGIGGLQRKTLAAVIGTFGGVLVAGIIALVVGNLANLTGFSSEEAQMLLYMDAGSIDIRGLLFAGIIIGALGAVMDVAMSIAAASHEVYCANPAICVREQIKAAMNVGRDVMGTMANTLILAYVGTALPMLLLFMGYEATYASIINLDMVSTEVIRALAGSIGLILAVPLTAVCAGLLTVRSKQPVDAGK